MDLYINSCDDDFAAVAVIRQFYDISFAEARDLVIDLPKKLPDLPVERFGELFAQLSAVGVTLSTGQPLPQQKPEPEPEPEPEPAPIYQPQSDPAPEPSMSMEEMFGLFKDAFADFPKPQPAQKPAPSAKVITDVGTKEITDVGNDCNTGEFSESDPSKTPGQWYIQIDDAGPIKLAIVKVIKETLDIGLREAMDFVSVIPACQPLPNLNEFQVKNLVDKLVRNGAKASAHFL